MAYQTLQLTSTGQLTPTTRGATNDWFTGISGTTGTPYAQTGYLGGGAAQSFNSIVGGSYGFTLPSSAVVKGITFTPTIRTSNSNTLNVRLQGTTNTSYKSLGILSNGGTFTQYTYGSSTDLWGKSWTVAEINSGSFAFSAYPNDSNNLDYLLYYFDMRVDYDLITDVTQSGKINISSPLVGPTTAIIDGFGGGWGAVSLGSTSPGEALRQGATITDRTQTGLIRIRATTVKVQDGKLRIKTTTTKTQTGVLRIKTTTTRTQSGLLRVVSATSRTQTGKLAVRGTTTQTQTGKLRVGLTTTRTQSGVLNVRLTNSRTQTGKLRISLTSSKTQSGILRVIRSTSQTQSGRLRVSSQVTRTQSGKLKIVATRESTQLGVIRVYNPIIDSGIFIPAYNGNGSLTQTMIEDNGIFVPSFNQTGTIEMNAIDNEGMYIPNFIEKGTY